MRGGKWVACFSSNRVVIAMALVAGTFLVPSAAQAGAHFVTGPTASLNTKTGDYSVSFKEAGLGSTPVTYELTAATENFTFQCFTKSNNQPQGAPNGESFSDVSTQTTLTPRNGQITGSITLSPEQGSASCQGNGLKLCLIAVDYENVTFTDVTNEVSVNEPNLSANNLLVCDF